MCARAGRAFRLPCSVKVARVPVKHLVLVRTQARQPLTRVAQLPERGGSNTEDEGESPSASATLWNTFGVAALGGLVPRSEFRVPRFFTQGVSQQQTAWPGTRRSGVQVSPP